MKSPHLARMTAAMYKLGEDAYFGELPAPAFMLAREFVLSQHGDGALPSICSAFP
jgi:hypothetical protein